MNAFIGTGSLIRLILRRDRYLLPIWIGLTAWLAVVTLVAFDRLYPNELAIRVFASSVASTPAELAMLGPVHVPTLGGLVAWRWRLAAGIILSVANILTVIRHTRVEEETGRRDLLGSTVMGVFAPMTAVLIVTFAANLILGVLVGVGLAVVGLPFVGSLALGLSGAAVGCVAAAGTAIAAQLTEHSGSARGIMLVATGVAYVLRAVGDLTEQAWLSWLSPLGWMAQIRPYADEQWWVFGLFALACIVLVAVAFVLMRRRDVGGGFFSARPGPAQASAWLRSPLALAWRLHRGMLFGWVAFYVWVGLLFGWIARSVADQLSTNPQIMAMLTQFGVTPTEGFLTLVMMLCAELSTAYAILAALRLRGEEQAMRAEPVLSMPISRAAWVISHVVWVVVGATVLLFMFGLTTGLSAGISEGDLGRMLPRAIAAALAYAPALCLFGAIVVALFGVLPRYAAFIGWGALVVVLLYDLLAEFQLFTRGSFDFSPFNQVPRLLIDEGSLSALLWMAVLAVLLVGVGIVGFQRRDVG